MQVIEVMKITIFHQSLFKYYREKCCIYKTIARHMSS